MIKLFLTGGFPCVSPARQKVSTCSPAPGHGNTAQGPPRAGSGCRDATPGAWRGAEKSAGRPRREGDARPPQAPRSPRLLLSAAGRSPPGRASRAARASARSSPPPTGRSESGLRKPPQAPPPGQAPPRPAPPPR